MHWTEIAAIVIVAIALVPIGMLLFYVGAIVWAGVSAFFERRGSERGRTYKTDFGVFIFDGDSWIATIDRHGKTIEFRSQDVNGTPDLDFIRRIPIIQERLDDYECIARAEVSGIRESYVLTAVLGPTACSRKPSDFTLDFSFDTPDGVWGESVFVDFENDRVKGWTTVD